MRIDRLEKAREEAKRFLKATKRVRAGSDPWNENLTEPGRTSAATKRASLDLTMALADLRRGDYA